MNQVKSSTSTKQAQRQSPSKERFILIFLITALVLSVFAYAMSVDGFTDYAPPTSLYIDWYDYFKDSGMSSVSPDNAVTAWPRWSAEYPYRALLLGRTNDSKRYQYILIYSKKPTTSLFRFEYLGDSKASGQYGYIRAKINTSSYTSSEDIKVVYSQSTDVTGLSVVAQPSLWGTYTTTGHTIGYDTYFDFDFYYDCTDEHQQNTSLLDVSGLRGVSVPYPYILTCDGHGTGGGASSGSSSSGGGSSGSGSSGSSGSSSKKGSDYSTPDDGYYSKPPSRSDHELSVPDDWRNYENPNNDITDPYPWEDDKNIPELDWSIPETPYDIAGEGDTGGSNDIWESPDFDIPLDPFFSTEDLFIPEIPLPENIVEDYMLPPDLEYPYGWPPPNPLFS